MLRKDLNDKFVFPSDSVSASFQLTLFTSSSKVIELIFFSPILFYILCFENGFWIEINRNCVK